MSAQAIENIDDTFFDYVNRRLKSLSPKPIIIKTNSMSLTLPKVLEIYFHVLIASCFEEMKWNIEIAPRYNMDVEAENNIFKYRGAPGNRDFSRGFHHFNLSSPNDNRVLELHLGVKVVGRSSVLHEIDVLICNRITGCTRHVYHQDVIFASEVKRYNEKIGKNLAREFIGVLADVLHVSENQSLESLIHISDPKWASFLSTRDGHEVREYLDIFNVAFHVMEDSLNTESEEVLKGYIKNIVAHLMRNDE